MIRTLAGFVAAAGMVVTVACGQTDAGITTNVKTKLAADNTVKAYKVDVDTQNHVVTLSGNVETVAARERALTLARETDGVRDVIDRLRVNDAAATSGIRDGVDVDIDAPRVDVDVDRDVKNSAEHGAKATGNAVERAGEATVDAAKNAGKATATGAKKVGGAVRDAVTDENRDSDHDGK
jgi:hypothetical protein